MYWFQLSSRYFNLKLDTNILYIFLIIMRSHYLNKKFKYYIVFIDSNIHICASGADFPRGMKIGKRMEKQKERKVPTVLGGETRGARCKTKEAWSRH